MKKDLTKLWHISLKLTNESHNSQSKHTRKFTENVNVLCGVLFVFCFITPVHLFKWTTNCEYSTCIKVSTDKSLSLILNLLTFFGSGKTAGTFKDLYMLCGAQSLMAESRSTDNSNEVNFFFSIFMPFLWFFFFCLNFFFHNFLLTNNLLWFTW